MPLVPELAAFLQLLPPPPAEPPTLEQLRAAAEQRSGGLPRRPVSVSGTRDLQLAVPGAALPARLYTPQGEAPAAGWPLVVFFHGGGFVAYSVATHDHLCRELCAGSGAAVLSVGYRLAPEHRFPRPTDDAYAAVKWAGQHAAELGADPARLAVAGDSAGASLSVAAALQIRDGGGPALTAMLLIYPAADLSGGGQYPSRTENGRGYFLTQDAMTFFGAMYLRGPDDAVNPLVSPIYADTLRGLPPALILTAEFDPLRDEGKALADKLKADGVDSEYRPGPGLIHGFANMTGFVPSAAVMVDGAAAWLRGRLDSGEWAVGSRK